MIQWKKVSHSPEGVVLVNQILHERGCNKKNYFHTFLVCACIDQSHALFICLSVRTCGSGLDDEQGEYRATAKKKRLSLSLKNNKKEDRFASITRDELEQMSKYKMPKNSELNSKWAMKNLADWVESYNTRNPDKPCPLEILSEFCSKSILNEWLCVYINETRNQKGESYVQGHFTPCFVVSPGK